MHPLSIDSCKIEPASQPTIGFLLTGGRLPSRQLSATLQAAGEAADN